jgi:hypothetical protein
MKCCIFLVFLISAQAESLRYSINWPSGLSLGEATLSSQRGPAPEEGPEKGPGKALGPWQFTLEIDASVPGFAIRDHDNSAATPDLCGVNLDKSAQHGKRSSEEKLSFDQHNNTVSRETSGGGKSDIPVSSCARDALSFIQFVRSELAQGRVALSGDGSVHGNADHPSRRKEGGRGPHRGVHQRGVERSDGGDLLRP